ncbi:biopolymer transporter ExbD [Neisseriaceae bacterium ESL0693]|nr:biopolymer transporter ExbD [Neisseriaceae bacterium ESL0693]
MSFGHFSDEDEINESADINVTPLVDVMLVLLIVFMITMPVLTHSIPLTLPTVANPNQIEPKAPLRLAINAQGEYVLADKPESLSELQTSLKAQAQQDPETVLAIAADKNVAYDHVAQALAAARDAGLTKVGFVAEDK